MKKALSYLIATVSMFFAFAALADTPIVISTFHLIATVVPESVNVTVCNGGAVTNTHVTGSGPVSSNDARLSGTFHVNAMVLTRSDGVGVSRDDWTITDSVTGKVKATGVAEALDVDATAPIHSVVTARLADGSFMSTVAVVNLPSAQTGGLIIIEYGGPVAADPGRGVVISRDCGGYFAADRQGYLSPEDEQ